MRTRSAKTKVRTVGSPGAPPRAPVKFVIPKTVEILGQAWSVEVCPPWSDSGVIGDCDGLTRKIRISEATAPSLRVEVFLHELLHAMLAASGALVDGGAEEQIVSTLAPMIWDTFRRNKIKLV